MVFEPKTKTGNSAKRKRVQDSVDMGQGDDRLPGTSKMMTDHPHDSVQVSQL